MTEDNHVRYNKLLFFYEKGCKIKQISGCDYKHCIKMVLKVEPGDNCYFGKVISMLIKIVTS